MMRLLALNVAATGCPSALVYTQRLWEAILQKKVATGTG
jgi:hypothetical protein